MCKPTCVKDNITTYRSIPAFSSYLKPAPNVQTPNSHSPPGVEAESYQTNRSLRPLVHNPISNAPFDKGAHDSRTSDGVRSPTSGITYDERFRGGHACIGFELYALLIQRGSWYSMVHRTMDCVTAGGGYLSVRPERTNIDFVAKM